MKTKEPTKEELNEIKEFYIFLKNKKKKNVSDFQESFINLFVEKSKEGLPKDTIKLIDKRINELKKIIKNLDKWINKKYFIFIWFKKEFIIFIFWWFFLNKIKNNNIFL